MAMTFIFEEAAHVAVSFAAVPLYASTLPLVTHPQAVISVSVGRNHGADATAVYRCDLWSCSPVGESLNGGSTEDVILVNPEPRNNIDVGDIYLVWVHAYDLAGAESVDYTMPVWFADSAESSSRVISSSRAINGRYNNIHCSP